MKTIITLLVGIAIGFSIHALLPNEATVADHWKTVNEYRDYVFNSENHTIDQETGLVATSPPMDIDPSLAALVSEDELEYLDIIFPTVPYSNRETTRHWLEFCEKHKDSIVWGYGNPSYVDYKTKGEQPLHLRMWFPESSKLLIQQLISELEEMGTNESQPTVPPYAPQAARE